jgi:hypothetical protein
VAGERTNMDLTKAKVEEIRKEAVAAIEIFVAIAFN